MITEARVFVGIMVVAVLFLIGMGAFVIAGTPGVESRQERFDRIEREIGALEQRVDQLEDGAP